MREMKDSGVAWIGEIPNNWEIKRIKEKYSLQAGFTPDTKNESYYDENGYDWVTISDIEDGKTIYSTKKKISDKYVVEFAPSIIPKDSLLYSFKLSVGQTAFTGKDMYSNEAIAAFLPNDNISLSFLRYSSFLIVENAETNIYGAKILNRERIKNALVVYPPLAEQQLIATLLDQKCSQIDALISNAEKQIEKLKAYKQSLITETVTKGLNPDVPMKDSGVEWIGEIAETHNIWKLKFLLKEPMIYGANESGNSYVENSVRYIRITDITSDSQLKDSEENLYLTEEQSKGYILSDGDVLFARSGGTVGKSFIYSEKYGKSAFAGYLIKASCDKQKLLPEFLFYYTLSSLYEKWKNMIFIQETIQNIGASKYSNMKIVVMSVNEQQAIVSFLDKKCTQIDKLISIKQQKIDKLQQYKKSIIYEYVTGKKEV